MWRALWSCIKLGSSFAWYVSSFKLCSFAFLRNSSHHNTIQQTWSPIAFSFHLKLPVMQVSSWHACHSKVKKQIWCWQHKNERNRETKDQKTKRDIAYLIEVILFLFHYNLTEYRIVKWFKFFWGQLFTVYAVVVFLSWATKEMRVWRFPLKW